MRGYLAAYDPSLVTSSGDYWAWRSLKLDRRTVEEHHTRIELQHSFDAASPWEANQLCGGCLAIGSEWCCFYRYFAGGRDRRGRPGRFVLVCCFVALDQAGVGDPSVLLRQEPFSSIDAAELAQGAPLPRKESFDLDIELSQSAKSDSDAVHTWKRDVEAGRPFHWIIGVGGDSSTDEFRPLSPPTFQPSVKAARCNTIKNPNRLLPSMDARPMAARLRTSAVSLFKYLSIVSIACAAGMVGEWRTSVMRDLFTEEETKRPIDEQALRSFLKTYRNADNFSQITTQKLLDRLNRRDWTQEQGPPAAPFIKPPRDSAIDGGVPRSSAELR